MSSGDMGKDLAENDRHPRRASGISDGRGPPTICKIYMIPSFRTDSYEYLDNISAQFQQFFWEFSDVLSS